MPTGFAPRLWHSPSGLTRSAYISALVNPSSYDRVTPPIFSQIVAPKPLPWKTTPTKGHLKGTVYAGNTNNPLDGAVVTLSGGAAAPKPMTPPASMGSLT